MKRNTKKSPVYRWLMRVLLLLSVLLLGPFGVLAFGPLDLDTHWSDAHSKTSGLAPSPQEETAALVQVYGARAYNWRGAFGIHTWIATKRKDAEFYTAGGERR